MFKGKKVLITGAYGFVGANLTRRLVKLGAKVHVLCRKESRKWRLKDILGSISEHEVDLGDEKQLKEVVLKIKPNIIYHLASYGGHYFQKDHQKIIETNLIGTINLLNALLPIDFDCFVNTGSSSEYGFKKKPMKESDCLAPVSFYGATKASVSLLGQIFAKNFGKNIVTLRPFTVYGYFDTPTKFVPVAIKACLTGNILKLTGGDKKHDYIFIEDLLEAYLITPFIKNISGEIINVGSGRQYANGEVVAKIEKICQKKMKVDKGAYASHFWDTDYWVADNSKARKLLGWKPENSLNEGLKKTREWFKRNLKYYG